MNAVIIVAGGSGLRMGGPVPKQDLDLGGKPLIIHTLDRFLAYDQDIKVVLVMARVHRKFWDVISISYDRGHNVVIAPGGETRYDSVKNGLQHIDDGIIVGIHDAVRPLVSLDTIERCFHAAAESGSGIPVVEMDESIRMVTEPDRSVQLDRTRLKRVQTPQVFRSELIKKAYGGTCDPSFTDDASVYESRYHQLTLVDGNPENIKITTPADLKLASLLL
jgi:2-C-methyl-D-erythritol 4-phosphate cytidylyltransferase